MAVKFSEFTEETVASNITGIVGYISSSNLNVRIAPGALNTSYDLTATDNAANNVPLVLTGSDSTADTVNFVGAGGIQLSSTGNVVTVTSDARVDSFTNANGTYVSAATVNTAATGAVTTGVIDLSAVDGTSDSTTRFLSKDNTWDLVDRGVTGSGTANIVPLWTDTTVLGDSVIAQDGTNIGIGTTSSLSDILTVDDTNPKISIRDSGTERAFFEVDSADNFVINNKSASAMILETSDTERMRITSAGNVGINVTDPDAQLEIVNSLGGSYRLGYSGTDTYFDSNNFYVRSGNGDTNKVIINSSGNVGIGTTSPSYKLTAYGSGTDSEIVASFGSSNDTNEYTAIGLSGFISSNGATKAGLALKRTTLFGAGELHFLNNTTTDNSDMTLSDSKMMINSTGNVGIGTTNPTLKLDINGDAVRVTNANPKYYLSNSVVQWNTGIATNDYRIYDGVSDQLTIKHTSGKVGIGTTSPTQKLHVLGASSGNPIYTAVLQNDGTALNTASKLLFVQGGNSTRGAVIGGVQEAVAGDATAVVFETSAAYATPTERMRIASTGQVKFNNYTSASAFTGTAVANLAVDSSGNIITDASPVPDDSITSSKVGNEFKTSAAVGSSATENIDWTSAQIFTLTPSQSTTLNVTNPVIGVSKSFVITGSGNSYTITLNVGGAAGTFNKISGDYDDTAGAKNLYSVLCVSATEFWYSISQIGT